MGTWVLSHFKTFVFMVGKSAWGIAQVRMMSYVVETAHILTWGFFSILAFIFPLFKNLSLGVAQFYKSKWCMEALKINKMKNKSSDVERLLYDDADLFLLSCISLSLMHHFMAEVVRVSLLCWVLQEGVFMECFLFCCQHD